MNILILTTHLNPGGVSRYTLNLAKGLIKQEHKVWVASSGGSWVGKLGASGAWHKTIPINTKSIGSLKIWFSFCALKKLIKQSKIDVVHANSRVTQCLASIIYKFLRVPYVSAFHGFYKPGIFRKLFKFSGALSIAVSKQVRRHLIKDLEIDENIVQVVYNGIEASEFAPGASKKELRGFKADDYLVGILGRISQEKGHFLALEAIKQLLTRYKNIYLLIAGEGKLKQELKRAIDSSQLGQNVKLIPSNSDEFLDTIDLLIAPSIKEGFGYSIVEAFAKRVPVVAYSTGGIAEIIRSRENGILFYSYEAFALAGAIEEAMSDSALRERMIEQAYRDVFFFSLARMVSETLKVYREVVE